MKTLIPLLTLLFLATPSYGGDDPSEVPRFIPVRDCFLNEEAFLRLPETIQVYYLMGVIDGFIASSMLGVSEKEIDLFLKPIQGKTNTQLSAIVVKYLKDNPDEWDISAPYIIRMALGIRKRAK